MFLDAALLLHQQPSQHLTALWAAQLELDDSLSGGAEMFRGSGWRTRGRNTSDAQNEARHERDSRLCQKAAEGLLEGLVSASLVILDGVSNTQQPSERLTSRLTDSRQVEVDNAVGLLHVALCSRVLLKCCKHSHVTSKD
jgi:hypothetical protein